MYILLALIVAAALGTVAHFALPHRDRRGPVLTPAIQVASAAAVYAVCTWTLGEASMWTWLASLAGPVVIAVTATLWLSSARGRRDAARRAELRI